MKKKFKMPHAFVIIILVLLVVSLMTYVIPGGQYDRYKNDAGTTIVDPNSFHYVESSPVGPWEIPTYIVKALIKQVDIIVALLVIAGGIEVVIQTNVFHAFCGKLAHACSGKQKFFIPVLLLLFSLIGITQAPNKFVGFAPIGVMLAISLGYDAIVGIAITLIGIAIGFSAGTFGPTTAVAQTIAELPAYSGSSMRIAAHAALLVASSIYIVRYGEKVRRDPTKSVVYGDSNVMKFDIQTESFEIEARHWPVMGAFVIGIAAMIFGCIKFGWSLSTTSVVFIWMAVVAGFIYGYAPSQICEYFVKGSKNMVSSALLVGIGAAGAIMLDDAHTLDTVVMSLSSSLNVLPLILRGPAMFIMNIIINFFISSASGQAAVVMPIFTPVADLVGVSRQSAVLAFKLGDGLSNYVYPNVSSTMGFIGAAGITYDKWMKFMGKLFLIWVVISIALMMFCQVISYV